MIGSWSAVAAVALGAVLAVPGPGPQAAEQPPECVHIVILAPVTASTVQRVHVEVCGSGPGGDSALRDGVNHHVFVLDGARRVGRDCGRWNDPCVIFPR